MSLKNILQVYEVASGQRVNLQKSSIYFGKGWGEDRKDVLKKVIGIDSVALNEHVVGRSKEGCFKHIHESSRAKVIGWKGQGSLEGR